MDGGIDILNILDILDIRYRYILIIIDIYINNNNKYIIIEKNVKYYI